MNYIVARLSIGALRASTLLAATLLPAATLGAQQSSPDSLNIVVAAARAIVKDLPKGSVILDEAPLPDFGAKSVPRSALQNKAIVRALGATRATRADAHVVCTRSSRGKSCEVQNADAFVSLAPPTIIGDSASVTIRVAIPSHDKIFTMHESDRIVTLRRSGGNWKAVSTFLSRTT